MKCKYCDEKAIVKVTPAQGGPVVDVCKAHALLARKAVQNAKGRKIEVKDEDKKGNPFAKT